MLSIDTERIGDLAVVECKGRIVRSEDVFKLRDAVLALGSVGVIALDLSEIKAIGGGGLGMLAFLSNWAGKRGIRFALYGPSKPIVEGLARSGLNGELEIANFQVMMRILMDCEGEQRVAA